MVHHARAKLTSRSRFLEDENGRRVAAFGFHAGYAGAAMGLLSFAWQKQHGAEVPMPGKTHYQNQQELDKEVKSELDKVSKTAEELPRILIIGALGRCGGGAISLCRNVGIPDSKLIKWDLPETKKGGPFIEIRESDVSNHLLQTGYCRIIDIHRYSSTVPSAISHLHDLPIR